ncbi:hypothetical protein HYT56_03795 [Candidatus Woesearchaeota archaeon]|nr:hypothetical protein [Candidatus Woesearchaeota archaeon]
MKKKFKLKRIRDMEKYFPFDEEDYPEEIIEDALDNDEMKSYEAGFLNGYKEF